MNFLKVKGNDGLVRDISNGAIINTNRTEYDEYMLRRQQAEERDSLIKQNSEDIKNLKSDVYDIKSMLQQLLDKR